MAYKMDPTKKKNKNGAINKIFKGIAEAGLSIAFGPLGIGGKLGKEAYERVKNQTPQLPSIQVSNGNKAKDKMKATQEKGYKTTLAGPKKMKKTLTNLKRTKTSSVRPIKEVRDVEPSAKNANIKGAILESAVAGASVGGKKKAAVKAKPKKVKVKIKNNKTKIKIKK